MSQPKLVVFITGQFRCFWDSWGSLVKHVLRPSFSTYRVIVCVGLDDTHQTRYSVWADDEKRRFEDELLDAWVALDKPEEDIHMNWVSREDPHHKKGLVSIDNYLRRGKLEPFWHTYLTERSGSIYEYAQFARLYEDVSKKYDFTPDDLLFRTRTDILFRYNIVIHAPSYQAEPSRVLSRFFPDSKALQDFIVPQHRESCLLPDEKIEGRWCFTMRKNLIYLMPFLSAQVVVETVDHYGNWDSIEHNRYWFNAESQFRGCLRLYQFTVYEYSQQRDECFGNFETDVENFPIYGIRRY